MVNITKVTRSVNLPAKGTVGTRSHVADTFLVRLLPLLFVQPTLLDQYEYGMHGRVFEYKYIGMGVSIREGKGGD